MRMRKLIDKTADHSANITFLGTLVGFYFLLPAATAGVLGYLAFNALSAHGVALGVTALATAATGAAGVALGLALIKFLKKKYPDGFDLVQKVLFKPSKVTSATVKTAMSPLLLPEKIHNAFLKVTQRTNTDAPASQDETAHKPSHQKPNGPAL